MNHNELNEESQRQQIEAWIRTYQYCLSIGMKTEDFCAKEMTACEGVIDFIRSKHEEIIELGGREGILLAELLSHLVDEFKNEEEKIRDRIWTKIAKFVLQKTSCEDQQVKQDGMGIIQEMGLHLGISHPVFQSGILLVPVQKSNFPPHPSQN